MRHPTSHRKCRRINTRSQSSIGSEMRIPQLPVEMMGEIVKYLEGDFSSLLTMSLLCRSWRNVSRRFLFANVTIENCERLDFFLRLIRKEPGIASWIHELQLGRMHTPSEDSVCPSWFYPATYSLPRLPALRTLRLVYLNFYNVDNVEEAFGNIARAFKSTQSLQFTGCRIDGNLISGLVPRLGNLRQLSIGFCEETDEKVVPSNWLAPIDIEITKEPRVKTIDIQWSGSDWDAAKMLLTLAKAGHTKFTETVFVSSFLTSCDAFEPLREALSFMPFLEELNLRVREHPDYIEFGEFVIRYLASFCFPPLKKSNFVDLLDGLSLENNKNLKRLDLEVPSIFNVQSIVDTLNCSKFPEIVIGCHDDIDFDDFAAPDGCAYLDELIDKCDQDLPVVVRDVSKVERFARLLQTRFPILHFNRKLQVKVRPEPFYVDHNSGLFSHCIVSRQGNRFIHACVPREMSSYGARIAI
ncbi:hypothetical protein NLI96_g295 [Meripilus lineatus]|uniref:F-box domain-containing protein n=1 Tax=Meripilus lineatus TaxID=2056292 RepID=A0AAD5YJH3_9APHY|nr:hypothetical protein NLI96_g295 [Physisporinus lineatus]